MSNARRIVLFSCLAALAAVPVGAQLQLATVRGVLLDGSGQPVAALTIELADPLGGVVRTQVSDAAGRFAFDGVAPGQYALRASPDGFAPLVQRLTIAAAPAHEVTLRLSLRTAVAVTVDDSARLDSPTARASIAGDSIDRVPVRSFTRGIQDVIATLPGWATEDNGLLHVRGTDDGFLYVIDGVPVYERLDPLSGLGPELSTVESINVITGFVPAEFGYKAGGVIDVRSKSAAAEWTATTQIGRGRDKDTAGAVSTGGKLARNVTVAAGFAAQQSDRFLDPLHPDNLHNHGSAASGAGQLTWVPSAAHVVSASLGFGRMAYDVPNTEEQEDAGQDQRQRIERDYGSLSWQRAWSTSLFSQVSTYLRRGEARLDASLHDTPLFAQADRSLSRFGGVAALTRQAGHHTIKAGVEIQRLTLDESFLFGVTDAQAADQAGLSDEAIEHTLRDPFSFSGHAAPMMWSAFAQDEWAATARVTIGAGIRFDESRLLLNRRQVSPRVGVAYRVADETVLRGSASRFFQPPQPENLLLSSSVEARELSPFAEDGGEGGADIEPERQWAFEAGVNHRVGLVRIDAAIWYRRVTEAADPNVFTGTTIIFPNAVAVGRARGFDLRLEVTRRRSWSGYLNASVGRVRQRGPITGGLFLEDEIGELGSGDEFIPDHDQRLVAGAGANWTPMRSRIVVSATVRYESGTPIERDEDEADELQDRPGADMVDFDRGRVAPRTVASLQADVPIWKHGRRSASIRASILNVFDDRYAYNFGNPFSGTHFGAPRTASLAVRVRF